MSPGAKSMCTCGHAGDGDPKTAPRPPVISHHAGPLGHGYCLVAGCDCEKFTWASSIPEEVKGEIVRRRGGAR